MIDANALYAIFAALQTQNSRSVVYLAGSGVYLSTGPVVGLSSRSLIMNRPGMAPTEVNPIGATGSVGVVSFQVLDQDGYVTGLRQAMPIKGQQATLYTGYADLPWTHYLPTFPGRITKFERVQGAAAWALEISNVMERLDTPLFTEAAIGAETWTGGDKSFDSGAIILQDTDDDDIYDRVVLTGNPITLFLKMAISGSGIGGTYDVWPAWAGAGLTDTDVDIDWCESERDALVLVDEYFYDLGEVTLRSFMEQDVCLPLGGYPLVSGSGRLRLRFVTSPSAFDIVATLTDSDLVQNSVRFAEAGTAYLSHVIYELDDSGDGPVSRIVRASPEFLAQTQTEYRAQPIVGRGVQSSLGGISLATVVSEALFARYANAPPLVTFSTLYKRHLLEAGDLIAIQGAKKYPDWDGRGVDATRLLEILSVKPGPHQVDISAIDLTGPITAAQRAIIAPNGQADWTSATETEKAYGYIAQADTLQFSDGEPAMSWG